MKPVFRNASGSRAALAAALVLSLSAATAGAATVALPAAPAALPASIQAKTALWLDASKNLVTDGSGNLVAWLDAREAAVADEAAYESRVSSQDWTWPRAVVWTSGACPSDSPLVGTDGPASFGGKPYVDFGEYNQNYWLLLVDETTVRKRIPITGYAGFIGFGTTAGFVVGDVNDPDVAALSGTGVGNNGSQNWHKGAGGTGNDNIYSLTDGNGRYGETRVNGRLVNSTATKHVRDGWEIFVENGPNSGGYVSTLFNNGNFKQAVSGNGDRQGGGKIAEIMLFSGMLTQSEIAEVEAYLRSRWQGGAGSADDVIVLSSGDALVADASTGPLFAGDIAGAGAIEKTGSGNFTIDRAGRLAAGPLALRNGRITSIGKRAHFPPLAAVGGVTIDAVASSLTATAVGDADTFTVNETTNRCVALAGAEAGVAKIAVSKAAATLQPQALPSADVATSEDPAFLAQGNLIKNGSFEDDKTSSYQTTAISEWKSVKQSTSNSSIGVEKWGSNTWANNNVVNTAKYQENVNPDTSFPDGVQCAFIQVASPSTNSLDQTVTVAQPGLYRLSAWIRCRLRRADYTDHSAIAWFAVDGTDVAARRTGYATVTSHAGYSPFSYTNSTPCNFRKVSVDVPLSAGEHTISIKASVPKGGSGDRALCVDDVRLEPVAAGNFVLVRDANFETMANQPGISENTGIFRPSDAGYEVSFWTFSNGGVTRYPSSWFWNPTYDGNGEDQALYLGNLSGASSASQAISFPSDGRVRVSFRYANRSKNAINGAARASGQTLSVSLGGTQFFSAAVTSADYITASAECDVSAGSRELLFSNSANATVLDDIRIEYVGGTDRALEDVAFADGSSSWTCNGAVAESDAFGLRELVFTGNAQAEATFTVPSDGYYLLTFQSRGRPLRESGTDTGIYHGARHYSHNLNVRVDGSYLANVWNEPVERFPVEMRLPYLAAGSHTIAFVGSSDATVAATAQSRISDVTVTPLATGAMADWSGIEFDLANGATVNADLPGTVRLGKLRVNGQRQYGSFTAANSAFVTGPGTVEVIPEAFVLVVR